ncbi:hypothetical protein APE01nite_23910 [Acetobacter peroxydans]|uniref:Uncharacterized protein n=1 Tax=Acetobacter peroxydans TaxID=104098 RepID=A0A4Y3TXV0_9PROT|nr:hypothetical protein APE01nite_23910 [Acetobacter peroxydans]
MRERGRPPEQALHYMGSSNVGIEYLPFVITMESRFASVFICFVQAPTENVV